MWQLLLFFITTWANVGQFQRFYKAQEFYTTLRDPVPAQLITQKVDHFCGTCTETFQQRFFVNNTFYKPGGPVFLCVGGEGPALTGWSVVSSVHCNVAVEYASQVNAMLISLEHRYYGKSMPVSDLTTENMKYCNHNQALADLANFVDMQGKAMNLTEEKWITFGGSYPGMMAGWARLKFPTAIYASVASSAPVQAQVDFVGYLDVVGKSISATIVGGSQDCYSAVSSAHEVIRELLQTENGQSKLKTWFNFCEDTDLSDANVQRDWAGFGAIGIDAQGNDPSCDEELCNIGKVCEKMTDSSIGSPLERLVAVSNIQYDNECISINTDPANDPVMNTVINDNSWIRVWTYQTCTEFAFYQTCELGSQCPFTQGLLTLDSYMDECMKAFGISEDIVRKSVEFSNSMTGGNNPQGSRILWPNGSIDPWYNLSVLEPPNDEQDVLWVNGASHHFWTHPSKPSDSPEVNAARQTIKDKIKEWLDEDQKIVRQKSQKF